MITKALLKKAVLGMFVLPLSVTVAMAGNPPTLPETAAPDSPKGSIAEGATPFAASLPDEFVEGEVLIRFKEGLGANNPKVQEAMARVKGKLKRSHDAIGVHLFMLEGIAGKAQTLKVIEALSRNPMVEFAEPNGIMHAIGSADINLTTADPSFGSLYGLAQVFAPQAWEMTMGNASGYVAVVDTGVNWSHPDLSGKVWVPSNQLGNCVAPGTWPMDDHGHGTHVSGTVAAIANNNIGVVGVAPSQRILAVKVLNSSGSGTWDQVACGINLAAAVGGVSSINLSLGGGGSSATLYSAVYNAWVNRGIAVVAANGNHGNSAGTAVSYSYPACYSLNGIAIAVGATDSMTNRASFSASNNCMRVAAPGVGITSTMSINYSTANTYATWNGTSMATPHVAGIVALMQANRPRTVNQVYSDLLSRTNGAGPLGWDIQYGYGIADAYAATQ